MKLLYIANIRLPTEKAHGLQIMQNCEAFADAGADVTLWAARRVNTQAMRAIVDVYVHYGVAPRFTIRRVPCVDLLPLVPDRSDALAKVIFALQWFTFTLSALIGVLFARADVIYSRDALILLACSLVKPKKTLVYEPHTLSNGRFGRWLQRTTIKRVGAVIPLTRKLADDLIALGAAPSRVLVAHDGVRAARFADLPTREAARTQLGWARELFVVGYAGRLHTMSMDKGVGALVEALAQVGGCALALVGGPDDMAAALRDQWVAAGIEAAHFLYAGQVAPDRVPAILAAFDVCAMPFPFTPHFAYYMSPLKLFEYMAVRRVVIASDLPSIREVLTHNENALLVPPGDVSALADAIRLLRNDVALRDRLADHAYRTVMTDYLWSARAQRILRHITTI